MNTTQTKEKSTFTSYQGFVVAILSLLQFTIVLDFMVLSPLGAQLMTELNITTSQFGMVVSAYAFSAGISGLLAAGFADKFDRKKLLLFFYMGFIIGTLLCGIAPDYQFLLIARIVTGIFGGVMGAIVYAIVADLFQLEVRGRVMGFVQMAFATSQVMGIPLGLYLANKISWHSPFLLIVGVSIVVWAIIYFYLKPIDAHLKKAPSTNAFIHLGKTIATIPYLRAFAATTLLTTGGFLLMPFGSAFTVYNLGISIEQLPLIYMITGICSMIAGPFLGKLSDQIGKYKLFCIGSIISMVLIAYYCNLGITPLSIVIALNSVLFIGLTSRMISAYALMTAVPAPQDRGAFMGINSSVQQISGGIATAFAGLIVVQTVDGKLAHYDTLGYLTGVSMLITMVIMYFINQYVMQNQATKVVSTEQQEAVKV